VSLFSNAGELRLGRDYTPTFWNNTIFDPFGTNGLGDSTGGVIQLPATTFVRADNSIGYFLPANLGGFYGQFMAAAAEPGQAGQTSNNGRYLGGRVGFAAGPFDVAFAYSQQRDAGGPGSGQTQDTWNIGGAYDFGFLKLMGYYDQDKRDNVGKEDRWSIGAVIPLGQGEIHLGYDQSNLNLDAAGVPDNKQRKYAATYQYNLSKRTAMYGTIALLDNGDLAAASISPQGTGTPAGVKEIGGKSKGFEVGIRHFF
jgi:predicted porin